MSQRRYFDPAQAESDHKDLVISQLKSELYELQANERDFNLLNQQLNQMQHKYTMIQEEKLRADRDRRQKMENDQKETIKYKEDHDNLKADIRNQTIDIQEYRADNNALREMAEFRSQELLKLQSELNQLQLENQQIEEENSNTNANVQQLLDDKKKLIRETETKAIEAETLIQKNRNLEKIVAQQKLDNQRYDQQLFELESFNDKINNILKEKNQLLTDQELLNNENQRKLNNLQQQNQQVENNNEQQFLDLQQVQEEYQQEISKGKDYSSSLTNIETTIRSKELHIDDLRNNYETLKNKHFQLVEQNKNYNNEIDNLISEIEDLNNENSQLLQKVNLFQEQDQKVRALLNTSEETNQLVQKLDQDLKQTLSPILHLTKR